MNETCRLGSGPRLVADRADVVLPRPTHALLELVMLCKRRQLYVAYNVRVRSDRADECISGDSDRRQ